MFPLVEEQSWIQARFGPLLNLTCIFADPREEVHTESRHCEGPGCYKVLRDKLMFSLSLGSESLQTISEYVLLTAREGTSASMKRHHKHIPLTFARSSRVPTSGSFADPSHGKQTMVTLRTSTLCLSIATSCLLSKITMRFQGKFSTRLNMKEQFCLLNLQNL